MVDVGKDLTFPGQVLLSLLILTGGLGLMAITTFLQGFVQRGSRLRRRLDRGRAMDEFGVGGIGNTFYSILITAAWVIGMGTLVLFAVHRALHPLQWTHDPDLVAAAAGGDLSVGEYPYRRLQHRAPFGGCHF